MKSVQYSPLVRNKMRKLKSYLEDHYDTDTAVRVLGGMADDVEHLKDNPRMGTNIAEMYTIDTEYWYLFTHQHYFVYRIEKDYVVVVQMYHEREDFMMKLFGISGRTQESIDYWGE